MCDFAPRQNYDFAAAVRDTTIACAGLFTPAPCIVGEFVMLITDPPPTPADTSSAPAPSHAPQPSAGVSAVSFMDDGGVSSILAKNARGEWSGTYAEARAFALSREARSMNAKSDSAPVSEGEGGR